MASNRSGSFCAAFGCNTNKSIHQQSHFFRFPKDKERSKRWVINCRREDLLRKDEFYLNTNCRICDGHFESHQFMNSKRDSLVWNAVPTIFSNPHQQPKSKRKVPTDRTSRMPEPRSFVMPLRSSNDHNYCSTNITTQKLNSQPNFDGRSMANKIVKLQQKITTRQEPPFQLTIDSIVHAATCLGMKPDTANFFRGQLRNCNRKERGHRWTVQDKGIALGIFFRSRQAYRTLCALFVMPSPSTLHRLVRGIPVTAGLNNNVLQLLKLKVRSLNAMSKHCVVTFDEMSLKKELRYDPGRDEVDGFVYLLDRQSNVCNRALVFMVRGLAASWKQPVAFYFSENAASAYFLHRLLFQILEAICGIGLKPVAVVCDQGSCNRSLYSSLGVNNQNPFFQFLGKRIYAVHDVPHILKNIRNNLKKQDIIYDNGKVASWKAIQQFYNFDAQLPVRLAPKLTSKHIYLPPFSPMRVNLAAQVCSHSVYAGIHTLVALGKMPHSTKDTANFLKQVNDVFDFLNIRRVKGNKMCEPVTSNEETMNKIEQFQKQVQQWSTANKKHLACFEALLLSLSAVKMLVLDLIESGSLKFLLTGRINQDCLENFFSQVRCKGGNRFNPSAREFGFAYRSLRTNMLMSAVPSANCADDQDNILVSLSELSHSSISEKCTKRKHQDEEQDDHDVAAKKYKLTDALIIDDFQLSATVTNVVSYIGRYVIRKVNNIFKCKECLAKLTSNNLVIPEASLLCHFKAYKTTDKSAFGSLHAPSQSLANLLQRVEKVFQRCISKLLCSRGVLMSLLKVVEDTVPLRVLRLCKNHNDGASKRSIIKLYVRCRLHYYFKFESRKLVASKSKNYRKMLICMHK